MPAMVVPPPGKAVIQVLDRSGHLPLIWDPDVAEEVEEARREWTALKDAGFVMYAEDAEVTEFDPARGEVTVKVPVQTDEFKPRARRQVASPRHQGG